MTKTELRKSFNNQYDLHDLNLNWFEPSTEVERESKAKKIISGKTRNVWWDVVRRFFANKWNIFFVVLFLLLISLMIIAPLASQFHPNKPVSASTNEVLRFTKPSWVNDWNHASGIFSKFDIATGAIPFDKEDIISQTDIPGNPIDVHVVYINKLAIPTILGTDSAGRDVWTRLWVGAGWSLRLAFFVAIIETIIGIAIGIYVGYHVGKKVDTFVMRFIEIFYSVPSLLWMFVFVLILGSGFWSISLVLILVGWVSPVYSARMFTIKVKDSEFIKAALASGVTKKGVLAKHILPNIIGRLLVSFVHRIPSVIFFETTLIFLHVNIGEGGQATIGRLIQDARSLEAITDNIAYVLSISSFLLVFSISMQIIANGIRDAFDPKVVK